MRRNALTRAPWPQAWIFHLGLALETSVLVALVAMVAGGALEDDAPDLERLPISLGARDLPALVLVLLFAVYRAAPGLGLAAAGSRWSSRLARVPPFIVFSALVMGAAAASHPTLAGGRPVSLAAGLVVGALFGWIAMPLHAITAALEAAEPRPWRELHAAASLIVFGSLAAAARGGAVLAAPAIGAGVALLGRGIREDLRDLASRGGRAGAAFRVLLGLAFALLGVGLLVVTTAMSLGWTPWAPTDGHPG
jgi:hypothetical protein